MQITAQAATTENQYNSPLRHKLTEIPKIQPNQKKTKNHTSRSNDHRQFPSWILGVVCVGVVRPTCVFVLTTTLDISLFPISFLAGA